MCIAATVFVSLALLLDEELKVQRQNVDYVNAIYQKGVVIILVSEWEESRRYDVENRLCMEGAKFSQLLFGVVGKPILASTNFSAVSLCIPQLAVLESHLSDIVD